MFLIKGVNVMDEILNLSINEMPQTEFDCSCGKHHNFSVHDMSIRKGAIEDLPKMAEPFKDGKILVVFDFCKHPPALFRVSAAVINGHLEVIRLPAVFKPFPNPHILIDALKRRPDRVLRTLVLMYLQAFPNS